MKPIIWAFGLLALLILLLLQVGRFSMLLPDWPVEWTLSGLAIVFLLLGIWISRRFVSAADATPSVEPREAALAFGISPREYEVLQELARGLSNREIAERLYISETTVKSHVSSLFQKLDARRRTQVVRRARERGFLPV